MYCPTCSADNKAETKFCTRCGTNLGVVSEALSVRAPSLAIDDRVAGVIKDYYKGRRDTITGLVLIPAAVKLFTLLIVFGISPILAFLFVAWMIFWGIGALAGGLGQWISSAGEMRALGYQLPKSRLRLRAERLFSKPGNGPADNYSTALVAPQIAAPVSATEETTRTLEEMHIEK